MTPSLVAMALAIQHPTMSLTSNSLALPTTSAAGNLTSEDAPTAVEIPKYILFWIQFWLSVFAIFAICALALFGLHLYGKHLARKGPADGAASDGPGRLPDSSSSQRRCNIVHRNFRHRRRCRNGCAERSIRADRAAAAALRGEPVNYDEDDAAAAAVVVEARRRGSRDDGYDSQVELRSWLTPEIHTASCFLSRSPSPILSPGSPSAAGAHGHAAACVCPLLPRDQTGAGQVDTSINDNTGFVSDHLNFTSDPDQPILYHRHDNSFVDLEAGLALVRVRRQAASTPDMFDPATYPNSDIDEDNDDLDISDNANSSSSSSRDTAAATCPRPPPLSFLRTLQGEEIELQDLNSAPVGTSAMTFRNRNPEIAKATSRIPLPGVFFSFAARLFRPRREPDAAMSSYTTTPVQASSTRTMMNMQIEGFPAFPPATYSLVRSRERHDSVPATTATAAATTPWTQSVLVGRGSQTLPVLLSPIQEPRTQNHTQTQIQTVNDTSATDYNNVNMNANKNDNGNQGTGTSTGNCSGTAATRKRSETPDSKQSTASAFSYGGGSLSSATVIGSGSGSIAGGSGGGGRGDKDEQGIELQEFV